MSIHSRGQHVGLRTAEATPEKAKILLKKLIHHDSPLKLDNVDSDYRVKEDIDK